MTEFLIEPSTNAGRASDRRPKRANTSRIIEFAIEPKRPLGRLSFERQSMRRTRTRLEERFLRRADFSHCLMVYSRSRSNAIQRYPVWPDRRDLKERIICYLYEEEASLCPNIFNKLEERQLLRPRRECGRAECFQCYLSGSI